MVRLDQSAPLLVEVRPEARGVADALSLQTHRQLTVRLGAYGKEEASAITVDHGTNKKALTITLQRTIRVPDNSDTNALPPSCGQFPIYRVSDYAHNMPDDMAQRGGIFIPMYQREAMWVKFNSSAPFAIKMYIGGVNAVSGFPMVENDKTREKRLKMLHSGKQIQDYMVIPNQPWLDGIVSEDGKIRQFVAKPKGTGFSVEAQVTGEEKIGGIQFEVIPIKKNMPEKFEVRCQDAQEKILTRTINLASYGITTESTWLDVKKMIREEFDIAIVNQQLGAHQPMGSTFSSLAQAINFDDAVKLGDVYFPKDFETLSVVHMLPAVVDANLMAQYEAEMAAACSMPLAAESDDEDGSSYWFGNELQTMGDLVGQMKANAQSISNEIDSQSSQLQPQLADSVALAAHRTFAKSSAPRMGTTNRFKAAPEMPAQNVVEKAKVKEMGISAGGLIKQTIAPDKFDAGIWDVDASVMMNVQILDSESFCAVTGLPPPPTPIDAKTYASHGYPFFEIWGEAKTGIKGQFSEVKSVAQIETEKAAAAGEIRPEESSVPTRIVTLHMSAFNSTFRPLEELTRELEGLKVAS